MIKTIFDYQKTKQAARVLDALINPEKRRILKMIDEKGECSVNEIILQLRMTDVSRHLMRLVEINFVTYRKDGKNHLYRIVPEQLEKVQKCVLQFNEIE